MSITLRDFLRFPFNGGRGIRTNQLAGENVEKLELLDSGKLRATQRNAQSDEVVLDVLLGRAVSSSRTGWAATRTISPESLGLAGDRFLDCAISGTNAYAILSSDTGAFNSLIEQTDEGVHVVVDLPSGFTYHALSVIGSVAVIAKRVADGLTWSVSSYQLPNATIISTVNSYSGQPVRVLAAHATSGKMVEIRESAPGTFTLRILTLATNGTLTYDSSFTMGGLFDPVSATIRGTTLLVLESSGEALAYTIHGFSRSSSGDEYFPGVGFTGIATHSATVEYVTTEDEMYRFEPGHDSFTDHEDTPGDIVARQVLHGDDLGTALKFLPQAETVAGIKRVTRPPDTEDEPLLYVPRAVTEDTDAPDHATLTPGLIDFVQAEYYGWSRGNGIVPAVGQLSPDTIPLEAIAGVSGTFTGTGADRVITTWRPEFVLSLNSDFSNRWPTIVIDGDDYTFRNGIYDRGIYVFQVVDSPTISTATAEFNFKNASGGYMVGGDLAITHPAGLWRWDGSQYIYVTPDPLSKDDLNDRSTEHGFISPDVLRAGVRLDSQAQFGALAIGVLGLNSNYVYRWLRHQSWWAADDDDERLIATSWANNLPWAATRVDDGNVRLRSSPDSYRELADSASDLDGLAVYGTGGSNIVGLVSRTLSAWRGAASRNLHIGELKSDRYELPLATDTDRWVGVDASASKVYALRSNLANNSLDLAVMDRTDIDNPAYSGDSQLARAVLTVGPVAGKVWDAETTGAGSAAGDLRVFTGLMGETLDIGSFDVDGNYWTVDNGGEIARMTVTAGTNFEYDSATSDGSFTGDSRLNSNIVISRIRVQQQVSGNIGIIINASLSGSASMEDWSVSGADDGGSGKSFYFIDASGNEVEHVIGNRDSVGSGFINWQSNVAAGFDQQSAGDVFTLIVADAGGLTRETRISLGRNVTNSNRTWAEWQYGDFELSHSLYYVAPDNAVIELPFSEENFNAESAPGSEQLIWSIPDVVARPAENATAIIVIAESGGLTTVVQNVTKLTVPTLLSIPTTGLPGGGAVAMSVRDDSLTVLFAYGGVGRWDVAANSVTRASGGDFLVNQYFSHDNPASIVLEDGVLLLHASEYVRYWQNSTASGGQTAPGESVASVGDDLVTTTMWLQAPDLAAAGEPSARWRWQDGWTTGLYPDWDLDRAEAVRHRQANPASSIGEPVFVATVTTSRHYEASSNSYTYIDSTVTVLQEWDIEYTPDPYASPVVLRSTFQRHDWWRSLLPDGTYGPWTPTGPTEWLPIVRNYSYVDEDDGSTSLTVTGSRQDWRNFRRIKFDMFSFRDYGTVPYTLAGVGPTHSIVIERPAAGWHVRNYAGVSGGIYFGDFIFVYSSTYGLSVGQLTPVTTDTIDVLLAETIIVAHADGSTLPGETMVSGSTLYAPVQIRFLLHMVAPTNETHNEEVGSINLHTFSGSYVRSYLTVSGQ